MIGSEAAAPRMIQKVRWLLRTLRYAGIGVLAASGAALAQDIKVNATVVLDRLHPAVASHKLAVTCTAYTVDITNGGSQYVSDEIGSGTVFAGAPKAGTHAISVVIGRNAGKETAVPVSYGCSLGFVSPDPKKQRPLQSWSTWQRGGARPDTAPYVAANGSNSELYVVGKF